MGGKFTLFNSPRGRQSLTPIGLPRSYSVRIEYPVTGAAASNSTVVGKGRDLQCLIGGSYVSVVTTVERYVSELKMRVIKITIGAGVYETVFEVVFQISGGGSLTTDYTQPQGTLALKVERQPSSGLAPRVYKLKASRDQVTFEYEFVFDVSENTGVDTGIYIDSKVVGALSGTTTITNLPTRLSLTPCPVLSVYSSIDVLGGGNVAQTVCIEGDKIWIRHPKVALVVRPNKRCMNFMSKAVYNNIRYTELLAYSCIRYFLWYLIARKWDVCILLRRNTRKFFAALSRSQYACWDEFFNLPKYKGFDKYYL